MKDMIRKLRQTLIDVLADEHPFYDSKRPVPTVQQFRNAFLYGECMRCSNTLERVAPVSDDDVIPEPTHQYKNGMHLRWFTGYGEFADLQFDPDWQATDGIVDFDLCHDCAADFLSFFMKIPHYAKDFDNTHICADSGSNTCRFGMEVDDEYARTDEFPWDEQAERAIKAGALAVRADAGDDKAKEDLAEIITAFAERNEQEDS